MQRWGAGRQGTRTEGRLGSMVVGAWGYNGAYALAGGVSMVAAAIALLLRRPGGDGAEKAVAAARTQSGA
ncbi:hypothetical protein ABB07_05980 [Streptomyces incarnatus]|uniref:Major facilitator superfamily (MFS) profile domain-containing protein n=1 Tax=Streptomyces incarnatus TaxID=665007 RepID=A0ABM5TEZ9_9ACTN|nr:hypothetical protein ABB07_05980 [Streptomyces incarnatus]